MKRGIIAAVFCLGAIRATLFGAEPGKESPQPTPAVPKIKFEQTVYDFGKTSMVEQVTGKFIYENTGTGVLKLEKPQPSCGCTVAGLKPEVLQPGEKGELTFTLNMPKVRQSMHKQITVLCNDPQAPRTILTVKAEYVPLYDVSPPYLNVNVHKSQPTNVVVRVSRTDGKPLNVTNVKLFQTNSASWIQTKVDPDPRSTNNGVLITTSLKPEGNPRYFSELLNGYVEGSTQAVFSVTLYGRILGDISWTPEMIYWPITDPSRMNSNRPPIVVRSALSEKLEIKNLTTTLKDVIGLDAVPKEDGKTYEIYARVTHLPDRSTNGYIRFETNIPSQPRVDVPITIAVIKPPPTPAAVRPVTPRPTAGINPATLPARAAQVPALIDPTRLPTASKPATVGGAAAGK